jgi:hypothetical protein
MFSLLIVIVLFFSCTNFNRGKTLTEEKLLVQSDALKKALLNTPYAALIRVTSVEISDISNSDAQSEYFEQKVTLHAQVLESYRGSLNKSIAYVMYTEKGESINQSKTPFIITLCHAKGEFYWPGVGSSFTADIRLIERAKKQSLSLNKQQAIFNDCID